MLKNKSIGLGLKGSLAAAVVVFTGSMANAASASFDFIGIIDTPAIAANYSVSGLNVLGTNFELGEEGAAEIAGVTITHDASAISVTTTALTWDSKTALRAYFDKGGAGLGVGGAAANLYNTDISGNLGNNGELIIGSDDNAAAINTTPGMLDIETVVLTFNTNVNLDSFVFVDADHNGLNETNAAASDFANVRISDDGGLSWETAADDFTNLAVSNQFLFQIDPTNAGNTEFYVSIASVTEVVPLPAAAWMGFSMLGGLGVVRKLRNKFAS